MSIFSICQSPLDGPSPIGSAGMLFQRMMIRVASTLAHPFWGWDCNLKPLNPSLRLVHDEESPMPPIQPQLSGFRWTIDKDYMRWYFDWAKTRCTWTSHAKLVFSQAHIAWCQSPCRGETSSWDSEGNSELGLMTGVKILYHPSGRTFTVVQHSEYSTSTVAYVIICLLNFTLLWAFRIPLVIWWPSKHLSRGSIQT